MPRNERSSAVAAVEDEAREIVASRVFDAPRGVVFRMWTDPNHIVNWYGPNGFTITSHEIDIRPGGTWEFVMHGPDGTDYKNKIIFNEIVAPNRIAYSHVSGPIFDSTVTFEDAAPGKTRVTVRMQFESAALRNHVAKEFGAVKGLNETLGRLGDEIAQAASRRALVLTRTFDAPRTLVFKAWTDPKQLAQWWGPRMFGNPRCDVDVRPGGAIHVDMRGPDGNVFPMGGHFEEIDEPRRLVFVTTAMGGMLEVRNTVTFDDVDGKTKLTLNAIILKAAPEVAPALAGMEFGWTDSFDRLAEQLPGAKGEEFTISRTFDAPREMLFDVWTKSEHLLRWFGPKGSEMLSSKNDVRPGGISHYALRAADGSTIWGKWVYRDVVRPDRLVFISSFSDEAGGVTRHPMAPDWPLQTLSVIDFADDGAKTKVTVRWSPYDATEVERKTFDASHASMQGGWGGTFDRLGGYLAS